MDECTNFHTESFMRQHFSLWATYQSTILKPQALLPRSCYNMFITNWDVIESYMLILSNIFLTNYKVKSSVSKYWETYTTIIGHTILKSWSQLWTSTHRSLLLYVWDRRRISEKKTQIDLFIFIPISTFVFFCFLAKTKGNKGSLSIFNLIFKV